MAVTILGLTGGIGSGKSVVARLLSLAGIPVFDCDKAAKDLYNTSPTLRQFLLSEISPKLYGEQGQGALDRALLAQIIFNHPDLLKRVEEVVHPLVEAAFSTWAAEHNTVALESAILTRTPLLSLVTHLVWVEAPLSERVARVVLRDNASQETIARRIQAQCNSAPQALSIPLIRIYNDKDTPLLPQVDALLASLSDKVNPHT